MSPDREAHLYDATGCYNHMSEAMAPDKLEEYRYTCWDTCAPRDSEVRCIEGLTYAELKQRTGFPDSLRERLDADVWPPALEWAGYVIELEDVTSSAPTPAPDHDSKY